MDIPVVMPQMGESVAEGTVTRWLKNAGQSIERDEPLLEISTDKVDSEIPSPASGVLREVRVAEGQTVPVGEVLAVIEGRAGSTAQAGGTAPRVAAQQPPAAAAPAVAGAGPAVRPSGRFLSPLVQKLAAEAGLSAQELESISGSGRGGRLRREDLEHYLSGRGAPAASSPEPAATAASAFADQVEVVQMDPMRKAIAEHMVRSVRTSPHVTSVAECDLTEIVRFRERERKRLEKREGVKLTYMPFVAQAVARSIAKFPWINASVEGDKILVKRFVNLGIAVALEPGGLIVPVVREAHRKTFWDLARQIDDLVRRARGKKLKPDEVQEGTFTITNPGVFGGLFGTPILSQPQVAILALGAVCRRPVVLDGDAIAIRSMIYLSLSYDHRVVDGVLGVRFLGRVREHLEKFDFKAIA
ncbi:MAG: dihydrolipoamide acetyltransferase family protein [Acidobacteriota bacterium]